MRIPSTIKMTFTVDRRLVLRTQQLFLFAVIGNTAGNPFLDSSRVAEKLLVMLQPFFKQQNKTNGREAFFNLLLKNKLLVRNKKRSVHTTNSKHFFYRYPNLVKAFTPLHAAELWVCICDSANF